jgi:hypothetical protein
MVAHARLYSAGVGCLLLDDTHSSAQTPVAMIYILLLFYLALVRHERGGGY